MITKFVCSALVLVALMGTGAEARDDAWHLPAHGDPRQAGGQMQTGCDAYGPGYMRLEGLDSCVKVGGSVEMSGTVSRTGAALHGNR